MFSFIVITVIALVLLGYVALPLFFAGHVEPLPDMRDPQKLELQEERDALLRAIRELKARDDLSVERRAELRARYEAKVAKVLRQLDHYGATQKPLPRRTPTSRPPYAAALLLGLMGLSGLVLGGYVLPRVNNSVITSFVDELDAAKTLQALQDTATQAPTTANLMVLADAQWDTARRFSDTAQLDNAAQTYAQVITYDDAPARAHFRVALATFQQEPQQATEQLETAFVKAPQDPKIVFALGEAYYTLGRMPDALEVFEAYALIPDAELDETFNRAITNARALAPMIEISQRAPNEQTLMNVANTYWDLNERDAAVGVYMDVLLGHNRNNALAASRVGQALFFAGRTPQALLMLETARQLEDAAQTPNPNTLLFLGNAYFSETQDEKAIEAWQAYIRAVGGEEHAGRVPDLIAQAQARLTGEPVVQDLAASPVTRIADTGAILFSQHCSLCHGAQGRGGTSRALASQTRYQDAELVRQTILNGRGLMPAFEQILSPADVDAITDYVSNVLN